MSSGGTGEKKSSMRRGNPPGCFLSPHSCLVIFIGSNVTVLCFFLGYVDAAVQTFIITIVLSNLFNYINPVKLFAKLFAEKNNDSEISPPEDRSVVKVPDSDIPSKARFKSTKSRSKATENRPVITPAPEVKSGVNHYPYPRRKPTVRVNESENNGMDMRYPYPRKKRTL